MPKTVGTDAIVDTRGWYAWNDLMPPKPDFVHVIGEVLVNHVGVHVELAYRVPQGINPAVLLLDLQLTEATSSGTDPVVWKTVRYDAVTPEALYTQCVVFLGGEEFIVVDVDTVHVQAAHLPTFQPGAGGRSIRRAWVGESPFPWFRSGPSYPVCLSGGLSTVHFDHCTDGIPYALSGHGHRMRVGGANPIAEQRLADFADKRVIITVCGSIQTSIEHGCQFLAAEHVEPAAAFSTRLNV